uniref:Zinc finger protein ArfGAP-1 n=1 Tax=Phallusia mammillata TaxID=59560 RepID=A0A6F9D6G4_9ASCI|nr:zinc finger protein ArfGAP-1 [Phallusia mammillata]
MIRSEYPPRPNLPMPAGSQMDSSKALAILELLKEPGNEVCADCGASLSIDCAWAVLSYGILVCDDCKLVHIELENHYNLPDAGGASDSSLKGILSTNITHLWEEKDIAQIRANGNNRSNSRLLVNAPVWQYQPSGNDGIKLKEYWIKCKYSGNIPDAAENPKMAAKKSFIGIQFTRPMPKGNYPCCAVLQNDTLYLTSDIRNEEVPVECVETLVVNSKRIGHENGVQITYRINGVNDGNTVAFTYLQHDNMETVMDWISLVRYTKYNLLKRKYPTMIDKNVAKILNCGMVKESYMHVSGRGLIYLSLSEARLSCFQHHLDDKPLFQIAVSNVMNLTASQYLDAVACYFDIDAGKILSYGDWLNALEQVLKTDKIAAMPDDIPKPTFPFSLLKKTEKPPPPVERTEPQPTVNHTAPVVVTTAPQTIPETKNVQPPPTQIDGENENEKKPSNYECYPPIGPMGEMGKVFRGELPPEAIKPPPPKNEMSRIGVFGEFVPPLATPVQLQQIKTAGNFGDLATAGLTSFAATLNSAQSAIIPATGKEPGCYPPIGGPAQAVKLRYDMNTLMQAQLRREQELEAIRNGAAAELQSQNSMFRATMAQKQLYEQSRLPTSLSHVGRFSETDAAAFSQAAISQHYQGWGDSASDNILTVPWKPTINGYEPSRGFGGLNTQYHDQMAWNAVKLQAAAAMERNAAAAALERKMPQQAAKGLGQFAAWGRPPTDITQQAAASLTRSASWANPSPVGMDHWPGKSPTSPVDTFGLAASRDARGSTDFSASAGTRGFGINGKVTRSESTSASPSGVNREQQMIIENLLCQWKSAEQKLLSLIHNGYVPASDMTPAGLDKDSAEHAYTCVSELFELLWKQRYDLALSFLRGFREVFAKSVHSEIRSLFIGVGELDTMKQIFIQQGKEKFLSGNSGGPVTWKQPTPPPTQPETSWPTPSKTNGNLGTLPLRESPTDFSPWGYFSATSSESSSLWGATSTTYSSSRTASLSSDPWSSSGVFSGSNSITPTSSFNRAPSRPVARSSIGENSPPEGSFGSKTSSKSPSPRVTTPTTGFDATTLSGIETTLKNIFLNSAE